MQMLAGKKIRSKLNAGMDKVNEIMADPSFCNFRRKHRQHYDEVSKYRAVQLADQEGIRVASKRLGIQKQCIRRWRLELFPELSFEKSNKGRKPKFKHIEKRLKKEVLRC